MVEAEVVDSGSLQDVLENLEVNFGGSWGEIGALNQQGSIEGS